MLHPKHQKQNNIMSYMIKNFLSSLTSFFVSYHVIFDFCRVNIIRHPKHISFFPFLTCHAYRISHTCILAQLSLFFKTLKEFQILILYGNLVAEQIWILLSWINVFKKSVKHIFKLHH